MYPRVRPRHLLPSPWRLRATAGLTLFLGLAVVFAATASWSTPLILHPTSQPWILHRGEGTSSAGTDSFNITGFVSGRTTEGEAPLGNVPVRLYEQGDGPFNAPLVGQTNTSATGIYRFVSVPLGSYWVAATPANGFGGEGFPVSGSTSGLVLHVNVTVFPQILYNNRTFVLPQWDNWSQYDGGYPGQVMKPILSWTQDGAFYVNTSSLLVFYSFANRTAEAVAPWLHLYMNIMNYGGFANEFFTTQDGSYIYGFGCLTRCTYSSPITFYGVNVTTGAHVEYNFSGVTDADLVTNGQIDMIGEDGSHDIAALIESDGTVLGYNILNGTQWTLGHLSFFEANNIYWEAYLNAYVDIQAEGSSADGVVEYQLQGPAPGTRLVPVYTGTYGSGYVSNGVDGTLLNVTAHTLVVAEASNDPNIAAILWEKFGYNASTGVLTGILASNNNPTGTVSGADFDINGAPCGCASEVERPTIVSDGPGFNIAWNPTFNNSSWIGNPGGQGWISTNVTPINPSTAEHFDAFSTRSAPGFFRNTSYLLSNMNAFCAGNWGNGTQCNINGDYGSQVGTVWYLWRSGLPEFPFPVTAARAQSGAPGAPVLQSVSPQGTNVTVTWSPPLYGAQPIVNWTLFWGLHNGTWAHAQALFGRNRTATVTGLLPHTTYFFALEAWNLHWHGPPAYFQQTTGAGVGEFNVTLSETGLPPGTVWSASLGGLSNTSSASDLQFSVPNGTYLFRVTSPVPGTWGTRYSAVPESGNVTVTGEPQTVNITFAPQYELGPSVFVSGTGSVTPAPGWYPAGARVNITAWGAHGYAFSFWSGTGMGNYSGPEDPAWVTMDGPVNESAHFVPETNYPLSFVWTNPAPGITWSVDVGGITISSQAATITFNESNGTYPYILASPLSVSPGNRVVLTPNSGTVSLQGGPVTVSVFGQTQYFEAISGAPASEGVVDPQGGWYDTGGALTLLADPDPGFRFVGWMGVGPGSYTGLKDPLRLATNSSWEESAHFGPLVTFPVSFRETGLPPGTLWSVDLNGVLVTSFTDEVNVWEPNGSWVYLIEGPPGYDASPASGILSIQGNGTLVNVTFTPAPFTVTFTLAPPGCGELFLDGFPISNGSRVLLLPGNYTLQVVPCPGHLFLPTDIQTSGQVTVTAGGSSSQAFQLDLAGNGSVAILFPPVGDVGWISGTIVPADAHALLDGSPLFLTASGGFNQTVAPGWYVLSASAPGYSSQQEEMFVAPGETVQVEWRLPQNSSPPSGGFFGSQLTPEIAGLLIVLAAAGVTAGIWIGRRQRRHRLARD
jgi:hypothetical protein